MRWLKCCKKWRVVARIFLQNDSRNYTTKLNAAACQTSIHIQVSQIVSSLKLEVSQSVLHHFHTKLWDFWNHFPSLWHQVLKSFSITLAPSSEIVLNHFCYKFWYLIFITLARSLSYHYVSKLGWKVSQINLYILLMKKLLRQIVVLKSSKICYSNLSLTIFG